MSLEAQQLFIGDYQMRLSSETIRSYKIALRQFFSFCTKDYDKVKAADIRLWLAKLEERGLKPRSIQLKLAAVKSFYRNCMEENKLAKNPTLNVKTPKKDDSLPYYLSKRQIALLQELTKDQMRERVIFETLYVTGVRISELLQIKLQDIKWESRQIWIRKGKGNKERFVLFTHECAERLKSYLKHREFESDFLFSKPNGQPFSRCLVEMLFRDYSKQLGFKVTPHTLRHKFAIHLIEKGMDYNYIQELLGHVKINSTRIYTRLTNQARKKQYDHYHIYD